MKKCYNEFTKPVRFIVANRCLVCCCICLSTFFLLAGCNKAKQHDMKKASLKQVLFPPADLYDLIVEKDIDIAQTGYKDILYFQIKYPGLYSIGVLFDKFPVKFNKASYGDLKLRLNLDFFDQDQLVFSKETKEPILHFASKDGRGFWLARFYSPDTIPIGNKIKCKVEVLNSDILFMQQYGNARLFIKKVSEK